jgi:hypothetical protein
MSGLANSVASVTQATKGFNVAIPVIIGVVLSLVVAIKKATLAWQAYKTAQTTAVAATAFSNIGFSPIIAGVAALAVVVSLLADVFKKSEQSTIDYSKQLEYLRDQSSKLTPLVDEYKDLASKAVITTDEHKKMKSILDDIVEVAPYLKDSITNSTGAYKDQTQVLATLNAELEKNVINQRNATDWQSISAVNNEQFSKDLAKYSQTLEDVPDVVSVLGLDNINLGDVERAKKTIKKTLEEIKDTYYDNTFMGLFQREAYNTNESRLAKAQFDSLWSFGFEGLGEGQTIDENAAYNKIMEKLTPIIAAMQSATTSVQGEYEEIKKALWATFTQTDNGKYYTFDPSSQGILASVFNNYWKTQEDYLNSPGIMATWDEDKVKKYIEEQIANFTQLAYKTIEEVQKTGSAVSLLSNSDRGSIIDTILGNFDIGALNKYNFRDKLMNMDGLFTMVHTAFTNITAAFQGDAEETQKALATLWDESTSGFNVENLMKAQDADAMVAWAQSVFGNKTAQQKAKEVADQAIKDVFDQATKSSKEAQQKLAEDIGYINQIDSLQAIASQGGAQFLKVWMGIDEEIRSGILSSYPALASILTDLANGHYNAATAASALADAEVLANDKAKSLDKGYVDIYAGYADKANKLKAMIEQIDTGEKKVELSDVQDYVAENPQIVTYLNDQKQLRATLVTILNQTIDDQEKAYSTMISNNHEFWSNWKESSEGSLSDVVKEQLNQYDTLAEASADVNKRLSEVNNILAEPTLLDPQELKDALSLGDVLKNVQIVLDGIIASISEDWFSVDQGDAEKTIEDTYKSIFETAHETAEDYKDQVAGDFEYLNQLTTLQKAAGEGNQAYMQTWASFSSAVQSGLMSKYPELADTLIDIEDNSYNAEEALDKLRSAIKKAYSAMSKDAEAVDQFKDLKDQLDGVQGVLDKLNKGDLLDFSDVSDYLGENPLLTTMLGEDQDTDALISAFTDIYNTLEQKQKQAYSNMLINSQSYWDQIVAGNSSLWQLVSTAYSSDASSFQSIADAKAAIDGSLREWIGEGWATLYSSQASALKAAANATRAEMSALSSMGNAGDAGIMEGLADTLAQQESAYALASQLEALANTFDNIDIDFGDLDFSGGGGGGGGSSDAASEIEEFLAVFQDTDDITNFTKDLYELKIALYESTGQYQGAARLTQAEIDVIEDQIKSYESYLDTLEEAIDAKNKEISGLKEGTDEYDSAMDDLDALQQEHQDYSEALVNNQQDLADLQEQLEDYQDTINDMEIDLRETIYEAIEDREEKEEDMLQGRIDMESEVMDVIIARYEAERDAILENAEAQQDALEAQKDLLQDNLDIMKETAEEEDALAEIADLQATYARISIDPTRAKEAADLLEEIAQKQEDLAWDTAQDEVDAQKDALDQQIDSLDEYIDYVNDYYEDLFDNPQKLIEEMNAIMQKTDEEIIDWLKQHSEDYADSSAATQEDMVNTWQDTLDQMHGTVETYWDEVEDIIAQGDQAIIDFLIANSADYAEAGEMQAQSYVDEWLDKLEALRDAYEALEDDITSTYPYSPTTTTDGSNGSGGGGGSGNKKKKYGYKYLNSSGGWTSASRSDDKATAFYSARSAAESHWRSFLGAATWEQSATRRELQSATSLNPGSYFKAYRKGGLVDYTGLAAVHGSKEDPEGFLSAPDTKVMRNLVAALHQVAKINVGGAFNIPNVLSDKNSGFVIEGGIHIAVDKLDDNADYERMAEKVSEYIYRKVSKMKPIGGIYMGK